MSFGGGGGNDGPTLQQQQLETEQAETNASLNLEENAQRKAILNSMQGTRVFRGSALSRAVAGNTDDTAPGPGPSPAQTAGARAPVATSSSLLDTSAAAGGGSTGTGPTRGGPSGKR